MEAFPQKHQDSHHDNEETAHFFEDPEGRDGVFGNVSKHSWRRELEPKMVVPIPACKAT